MLYRWLSLLLPAVLSAGLHAQTAVLTCSAASVPALVHAEGVAERTGDIVLSCSGGQPASQVSGNVVVSLNVNVTNRILSDGSSDVFLTVDSGSGPVNFVARPFSANALAFNGVIFNTSAAGAAEIRISNIRGNASQLGFDPTQTITASVSFTGAGIALPNSVFIVGHPDRALLATTSGKLVCDQYGSPLPATINFANLLTAGSAYSTTRVTEGFASAFAPISDPSNLRADSGVRILARYSGFPAAAHLYVPDAIAGSTADVPTATGDLGFAASGGQYTPGLDQLLLVRVIGTDANGASGTLVTTAPAVQTSFNSVSEVPLSGGAGVAVYEVVDTNPFIRESAQIPTFLGLAPNSGTAETDFSINLAPVSTVVTQSQTAPIPRFIETAPPSDCSSLNDCNAGYFPQIQVDTTPLDLTAPAGQPVTRYLPIHNQGAGVLRWTATVSYGAGATNFIRLSPAQGVNNSTLRVDALTTGLAPGTYTATILLDAGPLSGTKTISVTLVVREAGVNSAPPAIESVTNAADGGLTVLVPGSLATIKGQRLYGQAVQVTFDGTPAKLLYTSASQINLQVPVELSGKHVASLVVSVDGNPSPQSSVKLADSAPGVFPGGVLNQNNAVNGAANPAETNTIIQVFATGLPENGVITAKIHDRNVPVPVYGGAAPGVPGVQQVNIHVPADLPTMQTYVFVCGGPSADQPTCSTPFPIWLVQK